MYSVNWATKVISIPKADMPLLQASPEIRELNALTLWQNLRDIEDDPDGIVNKTIVKNTTPLTVAGVTLSRVVEIINGYTITFEDLQYAVNVTGGNTNVADVVNKNQVSVNTQNSAGLVEVGVESSAPTVAQIVAGVKSETYDGVSFENLVIDLLAYVSGNIVKIAENAYEYKARDGTTKRFRLAATQTTRTRS